MASETRKAAAHFEIVSVDQMRATSLSSAPSRRAAIDYLCLPSRERQSKGTVGQDYVVVRHNEEAICFAVCDGVGQSFYGHLAAQFLGDAVVEWLGTLEAAVDERHLAAGMTDFLTDLSASAQQLVADYALPQDLPKLVLSALERQRAYGSETMFVCGRLQFPRVPADPTDAGQIVLCWLGDVEAQVLDRDGVPINLGAQWTSRERWSTSQGLRGAERVHVWSGDLNRVSQIVVYSDGLASLGHRLWALVGAPQELEQEIEEIQRSPADDDVALLRIEPRRLLAPILQPIRSPLFGDSYDLNWEAVPEAAAYLVEEGHDPGFEGARSWVSPVAGCRVERAAPGQHLYRVRAIDGGMHGEASNVQSARLLPGARHLKWILLFVILLVLLVVVILIRILVGFSAAR